LKNKTRIVFFLIFLSACFQKVYPQKEGNIWTFPDRVSINFNNISNISIDTSADGANNGMLPSLNSTSISDSAGNLFCYTNNLNIGYRVMNVYDGIHHIMPNGSNLYSKSIFSSLLLTYPGIDSLIYLFYIGRDSINTNNFMLFFSLINKNLNGGFGDVTLRDSVIFYGTLAGTRLSACKHANGRDWWVFIKEYGNNIYHYFLLTSTGIDSVSTQSVGSATNGFGKLIFSNNGTKLMNVGVNGVVDVFDFDRCSGLLSNYLDIGEHLAGNQYQYFNAAFSPNGNLIYVSPWNIVKVFYQWNLNAGDLNAIKASKTEINYYPDTGEVTSYTYFGHNLAPDGKIYIPIANNYFAGGSTNVTHYLDVIEYPDSIGLACNYVRQGFYLNGHRVCGDLPNIPYYGLKEDSGSICDSLTISVNEVVREGKLEVFPNPFYNKLSFHPFNSSSKKISITVFNNVAEKVFEKEMFMKDQEIDLSKLTKGVYFFNVKNEKFSATRKIVKL
jgi:hypothetical protein